MSVSQREIVFKTVGEDVALRLHVFEPEGRDLKRPAPAIVFFFGGGWVGGSPKQFFPHCEYLASRGMVAASAEYRVRSRHKTTPFECVADGKSAVRWLRAHAAELGIDPDRIAAGGGSAGGHVAACTAFIEGCEDPKDDLKVSSKPNALALFNPVIDTTRSGYGFKGLQDRALEISPVHHVKADAPPTIVFHGTADTTVPYENAERFLRAMKENGNSCQLVSFPGKKHGFFNYGRGEYQEAFRQSVRSMDRFLLSLGYLTGEPTVDAFVDRKAADDAKKKAEKQ